MSTPIQNNSEALQRILQTVTDLPDAGSGGGVTVQRISGTFTTNASATATVSCGFQPDIVLISGLYYDSNEFHASVVFPETKQSGYTQIATGYSDTYAYGIHFELTRRTDGFSVTAKKFNSSWSQSNVTNATFNYVAIKYTE